MITSRIISAFTTLESVTEGYDNIGLVPEIQNNTYTNNTSQPNEITSPITNYTVIPTQTQSSLVASSLLSQSIAQATEELGPTPSLSDLNTYNANLMYYLNTQSELNSMTSVTTPPVNNSIIIQTAATG
jgi:hypothetical protein